MYLLSRDDFLTILHLDGQKKVFKVIIIIIYLFFRHVIHSLSLILFFL